MQRMGGSLALQQTVNELQQRVTRLENYAASLPASGRRTSSWHRRPRWMAPR